MNIFRKKCGYCRKKIEKGKEYFGDVKVPGYIGTFKKPFCSKDHALEYIKEINTKTTQKRSCCG
jgi:hypothetical protein